jgi:hypothetical protein
MPTDLPALPFHFFCVSAPLREIVYRLEASLKMKRG